MNALFRNVAREEKITLMNLDVPARSLFWSDPADLSDEGLQKFLEMLEKGVTMTGNLTNSE